MRNALRLTVSAAVASVVALTLVMAALADKEQVQLTAADQAFARAAVLTKADLGTVGSWTGGAVKPDLTSSPPCTSFHPKQSDLVLTGAAETRFKEPGIEIDSEAQVLQTAQMVALDWQRVVASRSSCPVCASASRSRWGPRPGSSPCGGSPSRASASVRPRFACCST
jgi:hypothetical protein